MNARGAQADFERLRGVRSSLQRVVPIDELSEHKPTKRRGPLVVLVVLVAAAALAYGLVRPAPERTSAAGKTLPEFTLPLLSGGGSLSSRDLEGSPVIVNFWASWCDPCRREAPLLERAWREHGPDGLTVLGVDLRDAPANARAFVDKHHITYPVVVDSGERLADELLDVDGLPQTFFVDSSGRFQAIESGSEVGSHSGTVVLGGLTREVLDAQIGKLLEGTPTGPP